ncbi:hypothetical protein C7Y47_22135 [Lysinibacillus sphaericus]|uniref:YopX protein domain-containing protein n=1 Tax=Lysinibacillus sphaericus TaxID=1421 RepID=A0A544U8D2_LYSSH|nr:YopX family protein [Lysinibacillus sp. SDF0037]TQR28342.1 hypothetical protein C7Y47_22135 [Lysinibacillus sp. SDF0037]
MREIKFRAWSKEGNRTVFMDENGWYNKAFIGKNGCWQTAQLGVIMKEDKVIKMQYTGLKDKNDKEIYEGDIVSLELEAKNECSYTRKSKITFNDAYACFYLEDLKPSRDFWDETPTADGPIVYYVEGEHEFEVIGNIYENPELLEELQNGTK